MRYHHTSIRMAWMKNSDNIKCCQGCGETGSVIAGRHVKWYSHSGLCNNRGLQKYVVFSIQLSKAGLAEQSQRLMIDLHYEQDIEYKQFHHRKAIETSAVCFTLRTFLWPTAQAFFRCSGKVLWVFRAPIIYRQDTLSGKLILWYGKGKTKQNKTKTHCIARRHYQFFQSILLLGHPRT